MNFTTNKEKGNSGLGIAIAYFTSHGYIVLISKNSKSKFLLFFIIHVFFLLLLVLNIHIQPLNLLLSAVYF